jgi:hypothetical protein
MSKIFEEAIADVKKLKEVAEQNAKRAIINSVTPKIRDYVEKKIFQEEKELKENKCEEVILENEELHELANLLSNKRIDKSLLGKAFSNLSNAQKKKISSITNKINENDKTFNSSNINNNNENTQKRNVDMSEKFYEIDLKLLREAVEEESEANELAEIYADADDLGEEADSMMYEQDEAPAEDESVEEAGSDLSREDVEAAVKDLIAELELEIGDDEEAEEAPEDEAELDFDLAGLEAEAEEEPEAEEEAEEELNEVFDVDPNMLRQEISRIKAMLGEGKMDHHFGGKASGNAGVKNAFGGAGPKKLGYQKSFGGGAEGKDVFVTPPATLKKLNEAKKMLQKLSRTNRAQTEKLNKYRSAVKTLREQLEDLNLFNAKLLYVNKLLQNKNLNEAQKKSVIRALDEAKSLGETKALFKSLTESLGSNSSSKMISESNRFGSSSRSTRSSAPAKDSAVVEDIGRWQKLAGLK